MGGWVSGFDARSRKVRQLADRLADRLAAGWPLAGWLDGWLDGWMVLMSVQSDFPEV